MFLHFCVKRLIVLKTMYRYDCTCLDMVARKRLNKKHDRLLQVASYGGLLKFTLQVSVAQDFGEEFRDVDIEIMVCTRNTCKTVSE